MGLSLKPSHYTAINRIRARFLSHGLTVRTTRLAVNQSDAGIKSSEHRLARQQVKEPRPAAWPHISQADRNHLPPAADSAHVTLLAARGIRHRKSTRLNSS